MSTNEIAIGLSALGFVFEAGGLATVVREIVGDRRRARQLLTEPCDHQRPERTYPGIVMSNSLSAGEGWVATPQPGARAKRVDDEIASIVNGMIEMKKAVDEERDALEEKLLGEIDKGYDELRADLRDVLVGTYKLRRLGAAALGLGILLSSAGSIVGNVT
jgi:hypothetical protein